MSFFYFRLVDTIFVSDYGAHDLPDEAAAKTAALELAQSLRDTRPELVGKHYSISVTDGVGGGVCAIPLDLYSDSTGWRHEVAHTRLSGEPTSTGK
jgi:hypothetical protein